MNNSQSKLNENPFQMDKTQKGFQSNYSELIRFISNVGYWLLAADLFLSLN